MTPGTPKLLVRGLEAAYGPARILFEVDLAVETGEVVALIGRNGAGKSTLLRSLMGLVPHRSGAIRFDGRDIARLAPHEIARLGLGYVPEDRRIFTGLTVEENLLVGRQAPRPGAPRWTPERVYALFPALERLRRRLGGQMSGGEQQMLTLGRTLMGHPSLLLLDEPSEGLAPRVVEDMAAAILALKREGLAILLSEQAVGFARRISDRALVLETGRVRFDGPFAALDARPELRDAALAMPEARRE